MMEASAKLIAELSEVGSRGAFGKAILDVAANRPEVVVVTADLSDATRVTEYSKRFPDRFFQVGIAEQNMIGVAAGLALSGKTPFATTFAAFASMRSCEQVRPDVAYPNLNVKILGADGGVIMGTLGITHYAIEDIGIFRSMPNMTILSPADGLEIYKATWAAALCNGPVYIRLTGPKTALPVVYKEDYDFEIGRAVTLRDGSDVAIIATGTMVAKALGAAEILDRAGISARVINVHTVKPLDVETIRKAAHETGLVVTVEEHNITGGLGSAVAEVLAEMGNSPRQVRMGLSDDFGHAATYTGLLEKYGLTEANIAGMVKKSLAPAVTRM